MGSYCMFEYGELLAKLKDTSLNVVLIRVLCLKLFGFLDVLRVVFRERHQFKRGLSSCFTPKVFRFLDVLRVVFGS